MQPLEAPAIYTPWMSGAYSVAPGLRALGTDFGNGEADARAFLIDREFPRIRANKEAWAHEARGTQWMTSDLSSRVTNAVFRIVAQRLALDYPALLRWDGTTFESELTGELIELDAGGGLGAGSRLPTWVEHPIEALAMQIQSDLAIFSREGERDWVSALHISTPSSWYPEEKIGKPFFDNHVPVPGFEKINAVADRMVDAMISQGPFVRFVWGLSSDDRLNHHPSLATDPGRYDLGRFWVRMERQTMIGVPEVDASIFVIHLQTLPDTWVLERPDMRRALASALRSMSPAARAYKSVDRHFDALLTLLEAPTHTIPPEAEGSC